MSVASRTIAICSWTAVSLILSGVAMGAARFVHQDPPKRTIAEDGTLQDRVVYAVLNAKDRRIRRTALDLLRLRGSGDLTGVFVHLTRDPDVIMRAWAYDGIVGRVHDGVWSNEIDAALLEGLHSTERGFVRYALAGFASAAFPSSQALDRLREMCGSDDIALASHACLALARIGFDVSEDVGRLVALPQSNRATRPLADALVPCADEGDLGTLRALLAHSVPSASFRVAWTINRIKGLGGENDPLALEEEHVRGLQVAEDAIRRSDWMRVDRDTVIERARNARLFVFGEDVFDRSGDSTTQIELLRAFSQDPDLEALGYEGWREEWAAPVLEAARELGIRTIRLDDRYDELSEQYRRGAIDEVAAERVNAYLNESLDHRMFVLRVSNPSLSAGTFHARLDESPIVVLGGQRVPLNWSEGDLDTSGRIYELSGLKGTFLWRTRRRLPVGIDALAAWMSEHG